VIRYTVEAERWPLKSGFVIARKALTCSHILKVTAVDGVHSGHGEAEAHEDDAELALTLIDALRGWTDDFHDVAGPDDLQALLPPGPARNALDCALWDMMAKRSGRRAWELAGVTLAAPVPTAYSIGIAVPDAMAASARQRPEHWLLKLKLGDASGETDLARVKAVRVARPDARLIVDANGAWSLPRLQALAPQLAALRVEMIEQPLPVLYRSHVVAHARRALSGDQHQAGQDRWPDRGPGVEAAGPQPWVQDHGRLHGRHIAGDGSGNGRGGRCRLGRSRRAVAARERS
jgi:L-alanine-DL-glutamate epimerase-like enolase superfamily enzyme